MEIEKFIKNEIVLNLFNCTDETVTLQYTWSKVLQTVTATGRVN